MEKEGKNESQHLGFFSTTYLATLKVYKNFEDSDSHRG